MQIFPIAISPAGLLQPVQAIRTKKEQARAWPARLELQYSVRSPATTASD